jgi:hypothetical protein
MSYSDFKSTNRYTLLMKAAGSYGTATAAATNGADVDGPALPEFTRRTKVNKVKLLVTTAPDNGSTNLVAHFLNGTDTFATVTLTTATAGEVLDGTVTAANAIFDADEAPTTKVTGTATASADANGAYDIIFDVVELYA